MPTPFVLADIVILNGQQNSAQLATRAGSVGALKTVLGSLVDITIFGPSALTGTVTVQVSYIESPTTEWFTLRAAGADVTVGVSQAVPIAGSFRALRLHSSGAEGADRTFQVVGSAWADT